MIVDEDKKRWNFFLVVGGDSWHLDIGEVEGVPRSFKEFEECLLWSRGVSKERVEGRFEDYLEDVMTTGKPE